MVAPLPFWRHLQFCLRLLLWSTLQNYKRRDRVVPYATGKTPGAQPISSSTFQTERRQARRNVHPQEEGDVSSPPPGTTRAGTPYSPYAPLPPPKLAHHPQGYMVLH